MIDDQITSFFKNLASRPNNENSVSDILFSFLKASSEFQDAFLQEVYKKGQGIGLNINPSSKVADINREITYEAGRADIIIDLLNEQDKLFIEIKIHDQNYHEDQYSQSKNAILILIALNPPPASRLHNWIIFSWEEIVNIIQKLNNPLSNALNKYLKEVLDLKEIKTIRIFEPKSILYLNRLLVKAIRSINLENIDCTLYNKVSGFKDDSMGYYFKVSKNNRDIIYPWFGLSYNEYYRDGFMIYLRDWHKGIVDKLNEIFSGRYKKNEDYFLDDNNEIIIMMPNEQFKRFFQEELDSQEKILKNFIEDFLNVIKENQI